MVLHRPVELARLIGRNDVLYTCEVNANSNFKVPGYLAWLGAKQKSAILVCLMGISSTPQDAFGVGQLTAQRGTHESGQGREWEGPLEIVSPANGAAIRFALGDGDKRENGDRF
ncbi:MAG TPA: hypothetical protein VNY24_05750 [Candidatus Acidoferrales bacterium]|nr:hypothetical protein [Candidatus Acidoferrales bacterium]